jgi:hypothetical protein
MRRRAWFISAPVVFTHSCKMASERGSLRPEHQARSPRSRRWCHHGSAPFTPTEPRKGLLECCEAGLKYGIVRRSRQERADAPNPFGLLRARRERPCGGRAAEGG